MPTPGLKIDDAINTVCPWSGKPISGDSLTRYRGAVVGFCNPGCRDKFERAVTAFDAALSDAGLGADLLDHDGKTL
ncbi:MAG: glutathione S-transferase [Hyphomicrobiales bacterium]|nr:glutathione S-transferase [Hyphomicrobiales bacterium]